MLKTARLLTRRKVCPRCGARTDRVRTPFLLRWLKPLFGSRVSARRCYACRGWRGITLAPLTRRAPPRDRSRQAPAGPVVVLSDDAAEAALMASVLVRGGHEAVVLGKQGATAARISGFGPRLVLVHDASAADCPVFDALRSTLRPVPVLRIPGRAAIDAALGPK